MSDSTVIDAITNLDLDLGRAREVPRDHVAGGVPPRLGTAIKVIDDALDTIVIGLHPDAATKIAIALRKAGLL